MALLLSLLLALTQQTEAKLNIWLLLAVEAVVKAATSAAAALLVAIVQQPDLALLHKPIRLPLAVVARQDQLQTGQKVLILYSALLRQLVADTEALLVVVRQEVPVVLAVVALI